MRKNNKFRNDLISLAIGIVLGTILSICAVYSRSQAKESCGIVKTGNAALQDYYEKHMSENSPENNELQEEMYYDSLDYLACLVEAEAENQNELGKRLVVDVVLNRVDSEDFPDDICDVINEKGQFESVSNDRINKVSPKDETFGIIKSELENRTNNDVLFFRTEKYHDFAEDLFQQGDHYFSK